MLKVSHGTLDNVRSPRYHKSRSFANAAKLTFLFFSMLSNLCAAVISAAFEQVQNDSEDEELNPTENEEDKDQQELVAVGFRFFSLF